jgi:hypothetical protein
MKFILACSLLLPCAAPRQRPMLHLLAFYSDTVERDHVDFAHQAIQFCSAEARRDDFEFRSTSNWDDLNAANLAHYQVVLWLDDQPKTRSSAPTLNNTWNTEAGGLDFTLPRTTTLRHIGLVCLFSSGRAFYGNNWPPLPAKLRVKDPSHSLTQGLPAEFLSPPNEWYISQPSPRA